MNSLADARAVVGSPEDFARPCTARQRAEFVVGAPPVDEPPSHFDEVLSRDTAMSVGFYALYGAPDVSR